MNEIFFLDNISIFSKKKKIENINLKICRGDFFVIKGSNSTGKSLLLKLFYLKLLPSKGSFFLNGKKITEESKKKLLKIEKKWE